MTERCAPSKSGNPVATESRETAVRAALVHQLYSQSKIGAYGAVLTAVIATAALWGGVAHRILLSWLSVFLLLQVARVLIHSGFVKGSPQGREAIRWESRFVVVAAMTQLWWGLLGIVAFPAASFLQQFVLAAVITTVAASVAVSHAAVTSCYVSSVLLTGIPIIVRLFYEGGTGAYTLGLVGVVYTCALLGTGRAAHKGILDSIRLTLEKEDLLVEVLRIGQDLESRIRERTAELVQSNERLLLEVSERKKTEEQLESSLSAALHLRGEAEAANMAKSQFLAMMSHEIRTPLNAIIGFSEMLQDQHPGVLNGRQLKWVGHVVASGRHLLSLVSDILDLSSIEVGKLRLNPSPLDVAKAIEASVFMVRDKALRHDLRLEVRTSDNLAHLQINADEVRIKQILFNLLSNAAKFTPDGGAIELEARTEQNDLIVSIRDTGIGILAEDQNRIFKAFEQVGSSYSRPYGGTGLGLALTKNLVELHGGRIWVESKGTGMGSTFSFTIPLNGKCSKAEQPNCPGCD